MSDRKIVTQNRKARHDYEIQDIYEAGLVLVGSEVKSLRAGNANLKDSFVQIDGGEAFLVGSFIAPYAFARLGGHDPERRRKLLLHGREIEKLRVALVEKGLSLIPLSLYFTNGRAKVELGLGRGRRQYDKRHALKERDQKREMQRAVGKSSKNRM
ncbi:MAG: SsrA-binding protein SmpB [Acidimicrobiia bacterium]|nr:SsrA-binding protein SmpB [Acidimicrobiia bacterium]